jgi:uncharacterized repeat protein (TIGR01451 family)
MVVDLSLRPLKLLLAGAVLAAGASLAGPYPPTLSNGAAHFPAVEWPSEPANPLACGAECGQWKPYTRFQSGIADPRVQDPSNGGTAPQNYVNISSSCVDKTYPSVYYALRQGAAADGSEDVIMFRWRVEQIANTYATGPNAGAYGASDPWNSALWSVLFDVDGDGYLDLAAHLDGSSGSPSTSIDRIAGIWSTRPTQSLDYIGDPVNVKLLAHNPTAFVDPGTSRLLNFGNRIAGAPQPTWPNGSAETTWDYGTTRAKRVSSSPCNEFFIDYQIPVKMIDASSQGGPKITRSTPISMVFCTANSLNNPFQKDCAINAQWTGEAAKAAPFGDYVSFNQTEPYAQPIVSKVVATPPNTCPGSYTLSATVQDTLAVVNGSVVPSVQAVRFYYYHDANGNGLADDGGTWTFAADAALRPGTLNTWTAQWSGAGLPKGAYLIGVQALDDNTKVDLGVTPSGVNNRTFSYVAGDAQNRIEVGGTPYAPVPAHDPALPAPGSAENWWGNPSVTGTQVALVGLALNNCGVAPTITKSVGQASLAAGNATTFTINVANTTGSAITLSRIDDPLPSGFVYKSTTAFTNGGAAVGAYVGPQADASGTVSWVPNTAVTVASGSSVELSFVAQAGSVAGNYNNTASASTSFGTLTSSPVALQVDAARLSLTKTPSQYSINPDGTTQLTFTLRYANDSAVTVTAASITDALPAGVSYVSCGGAPCGNAAGTVTWTLGTLAGGASGSVTVTVTVNTSYSSASLVNSATVSATPPGGGTVTATGATTVAVNAPMPAFTLTKTSNSVRVAPGGSIVWTLNYRNYGTGTATGVVISDTLPAGITFTSCTGGCTHSNGVVTWSLGTVAAGAAASVTLTTAVVSETPFTYPNPVRNTARLIWTGDANGVTASADVGVTGESCSAVYYFHGPSSNRTATLVAPAPGDPTISESPAGSTLVFAGVAPSGGIAAGGKKLTISFFMSTSTGNGNFRVVLYNVSKGQTVADSGTLGVTQTGGVLVLRTFTADVGSGVTISGGDSLEWRFTLAGAQPPSFGYNSTAHNSRSSFCDPAAPANLTLTKAANQAQVSTLPANVEYTLRFANTGGADATAVTLRDVFPAHVTMTSATLNGTPVNLGATPYGNPYTFTVNSPTGTSGVVKAGESGTLVINATVGASASGTLTNTANIAVAGTTAATATADTLVGSLSGNGTPQLAVQLQANRTTAVPGDTVTYTVTLTNVGAGSANNVQLSNPLPLRTYYTYGSCSGGCSVSGNTAQWTLASLAAGSSVSYTFTMQVGPTGLNPGVTVVPDQASAQATSVASVDSNTVNVSISGNPQLGFTKQVSGPANPAPGQAVTYTLTVTNTGSSAATAVVVTDPIPSGLRYSGTSSASTGTASFDAVNNRMVFAVGDLPAGGTASLSLGAVVQALAAGNTSIVNTATVSAQNAPSRTASVQITATATPQLTLSKQGPAQVSEPAATLTQPASNATVLRVNDSSQIALGQYVSVGGSTARVVDLSPTTLTLASPVTAVSGAVVRAAVTYTLTYQNTGTATATSVSLADTLPPGLEYVAANPPGTVAGNVVTWNLGNLDPEAGGSVQLVALPTAAGSYTNQASIQCGVCGAAVQASATTSVGGLVVNKRTTTPTVAAGGLAQYVIDVRNTASTAIAAVAVTDVLAPGFVYESTGAVLLNGASVAPASAPTPGDSTLSWGSFAVQPGETLSVRFAARVSADAGTATYQNEAAARPVSRMVAYDFLGSTAEDVVVLGTDVGQIAGVVFQDNDNNGAFDAAVDTPFSGVTVRFYDSGNALVYEEVTDAAGRYSRVVPLGSWRVQAVTTGLPAGLALGASFSNPAVVTVVAQQSQQASMGFVSAAALPDLTLTKSHSGHFSQGQAGAQYQLVVTNAGTGPSAGTVTVTDTLPPGLTATALGGSGWNCVLATLACSRSDVLAAGASYPAILLTVNVAANAAAQVTNQAAVSGGGEANTANNSASDVTVITAVSLAPDLTLTKTHTGNFTQGQTGAVYTITVRNAGTGPTAGTVTVADQLPAGLTATALSGSGWSCSAGTLSCTRSDSLAAGASWPVITLTVAVSTSAAASVTNTATVSGGGDATPGNNTASDPTTIGACNCTLSGHVFQDLNRNGIKDPGEPPFANVQITVQQVTQGAPNALQLRNALQTKAGTWTITTDVNGNFSVQLPGVTTVRLFVTPPPGYTETTNTEGQLVTVGQVMATALPVGLVPAGPSSPSAIPVAGPWALALMSLLLGGLGAVGARARRPRRP